MMWGQVVAVQMGTYNTCLYKEVYKNYTGCNLKTTRLLDCAFIRVCAVIRSNTVGVALIILFYALLGKLLQ